jgi:hypothetical protein
MFGLRPNSIFGLAVECADRIKPKARHTGPDRPGRSRAKQHTIVEAEIEDAPLAAGGGSAAQVL